MKLPSALAFVEEESAVAAAKTLADAVEGMLSPLHAPAPSVAIGIEAGKGKGDYHIALRSESAEAMAPYVAKAHGEANAQVVTASAIDPNPNDPVPSATPSWLNQRRDPLEGGVAISPRGAGFVGTQGVPIRDLLTGAYGALSNRHVVTGMGEFPEGTPILQPFGGEAIGVASRAYPTGPAGNLADAQILLYRSVAFAPGMIAGRQLRPPVRVTPEMIGARAWKQGRTTGLTELVCTAVGLRNLGVNYGGGKVLYFDDQVEWEGIDGIPGSAGGDSGSLIVLSTGEPASLLFAGGGVKTFGNQIVIVVDGLKIEILLGGMS